MATVVTGAKRGRPLGPNNDLIGQSDRLGEWINERAWGVCTVCNATLVRRKLFPADLTSDVGARGKRTQPDCGVCISKTTPSGRKKHNVTPTIGMGQVSKCLAQLTDREVLKLRPVQIHSGSRSLRRYGYRVLTRLARLSWRKQKVSVAINNISDMESRDRCLKAYQYLMQQEESSPRGVYKEFILRHERLLEDWRDGAIPQLPFVNEGELCLEAALFPHLYPTRESCDTHAQTLSNKSSAKESYFHKVMNVDGYRFRNNWELLVLSFQRYMQQTITGAVRTSGNRIRSWGETNSCGSKCLESKPFTEEYWRNRRAELLDCVRQHGHPSLFVTVAPDDGSFVPDRSAFPLPRWLFQELVSNDKQMARDSPTAFTLHFSHVMGEIVNRVLCGMGTAKEQWKKLHWLRDTRHDTTTSTNVICYFNRLEFQKRGTPHCHILIWLKRCSRDTRILQLCKADLDNINSADQQLIKRLQTSGKRPNIPNNEAASFVSPDGTIVLRHPVECDFLRPYFYPLVTVLRSHMDVQLSPGKLERDAEQESDKGRGLLMRYVTQYGVKIGSAETLSNERLMTAYFNNCASGEQSCLEAQVRCAMQQFTMTEPEMTTVMSDMKVCHFSGLGKILWLPSYWQLISGKTECLLGYRHYLNRPSECETMTILEFFRVYKFPTIREAEDRTYEKHSAAVLSKTVAVGVDMGSPLNDSFYWRLCLCFAHYRDGKELLHGKDTRLSSTVKGVSACMKTIPQLLEVTAFKTILTQEGHRDSFIEAALGYLAGQRQVVDYILNGRLTDPTSCCMREGGAIPSYQELDLCQQAAVDRYRCLVQYHDASQEEAMAEGHWRVMSPEGGYSLIAPPGYGKTVTILAIVKMFLVEYGLPVMCAFPTAITGVRFLQKLKHDSAVAAVLSDPETKHLLKVDTVHNCFGIPVDYTKGCRPIWGLAKYALVAIDEISMILGRVMNHILYWWSTTVARPALLLSGDFFQLQPIPSQPGERQVSCKDIALYKRLVTRLHLARSHRTTCSELLRIMDQIRRRTIDSESFRALVRGRWRAPGVTDITEADVRNLFVVDGIKMVLTYTNKATLWINKVILHSDLFTRVDKLGEAYFDTRSDKPEKLPVYKGMRVLTTANLDKTCGIVNGMIGFVEEFDESYCYLVIRNEEGQLFTLSAVPPDFPLLQHHVSWISKGARIFTCCPAYAITIHKAQGCTCDYRIAIYLDNSCSRVDPRLAYVAVSRATSLSNLFFLGNLSANQLNGLTAMWPLILRMPHPSLS